MNCLHADYFGLTQTPQTYAETYIAIARMCHPVRTLGDKPTGKSEATCPVCVFCEVCVR